MSADCLFCKIIAGIIPVKPLYDDEEMIAIQDINPQAPLHALIIPKTHIPSLNDLTPEHEALVGRMFRRAAALTKARGHDVRGYRTVFNTGPEAGQSVFHIHLHVLAGRAFGWPPG
ncbi:MAG: histidine triad nucleotide-binding protein [Acidobacteria bacterium]|nr:MAG: histidine triad nucleotide-binding protein [Acidobacteriota bacterium]